MGHLLATTTVGSFGGAYHRYVVARGHQPELVLYLSFILTVVLTRVYTTLSRHKEWFPGSGKIGDTHIHHMVVGIILLIVVGFGAIAFNPHGAARAVVAALFGAGMGFTLDEFALWLYVRDVYWAEEGRRSIEAIAVAAALMGLVLMGTQIWIGLAREVNEAVRVGTRAWWIAGVLVAIVNASKGKLGFALVSLALPPVGIVAAVRLAKPGSPWSTVFYGGERHVKAAVRFADRSPLRLRPWRKA